MQVTVHQILEEATSYAVKIWLRNYQTTHGAQFEGLITLNSGKQILYKGKSGIVDFSRPPLKDTFEKIILPNALKFYEEATRKGLGPDVRDIWGAEIVNQVIHQDRYDGYGIQRVPDNLPQNVKVLRL